MSAFSLAQPAPELPPAPAPAASEEFEGGEKIERDTDDAYDTTIELLPGGQFPAALDLFSISIRNAALRGWVKQPSPCCAASVIAGCFNTVRGLERTDKENGALAASDVIAVMDCQLEEDRASKHASAARLLGLKDPEILAALEQRVGQIQDAKGRPLISRKKDALKPPDLRAAVKEATAKAMSGGFDGMEEAELELWKILEQIYAAADAAKATGASASNETVILSAEDRKPLAAANPNAAAGEEADDDESEVLSGGALCGDVSGEVTLQRDVNKALVSALQVHIGLLKLRGKNPSTAFFGNGDVLKTVRKLSEKLGVQVVGRNYCGKGLRGSSTINLTANDSAETQESQWRTLVAEFARSDTALLMHMTNHVCMLTSIP